MQFYNVKTRQTDHFTDWLAYQAAHNTNRAYAASLPYYEALTHASLTLLPSAHPWWLFQHYLWAKDCFAFSIRTMRSYAKMQGPGLNPTTAARLAVATRTAEHDTNSLRTKCQRLQRELTDLPPNA